MFYKRAWAYIYWHACEAMYRHRNVFDMMFKISGLKTTIYIRELEVFVYSNGLRLIFQFKILLLRIMTHFISQKNQQRLFSTIKKKTFINSEERIHSHVIIITILINFCILPLLLLMLLMLLFHLVISKIKIWLRNEGKCWWWYEMKKRHWVIMIIYCEKALKKCLSKKKFLFCILINFLLLFFYVLLLFFI